MAYRATEVSGGHAEMKKWLYALQDADCLVFIVPLSEYDAEPSSTGGSQQGLRDSIAVFESVITSDRFLGIKTIVLLLNKIDLFRKKLQDVPIHKFWPEFNGPQGHIDAATRFFTDKFCARQRQDDTRMIHVYNSDATDTENSRVVLQSIEALLLSRTSPLSPVNPTSEQPARRNLLIASKFVPV